MDARATEFGSAEAKARFSELLARVEAGETITIRRHGNAIAKLTPVKPVLSVEERRRKLEEFFAWRKEHGPRLQPGDDLKQWINEGRP
ncbi:MAG: type II toxin-antitoxin system prevent-host-death family antitoxin [Alphaproteobacteria bacterium]|nr:MAG: type II toxin-antitoxin system prevent-host-death family antitoxin [Alphaproteobacteria bacterium]